MVYNTRGYETTAYDTNGVEIRSDASQYNRIMIDVKEILRLTGDRIKNLESLHDDFTLPVLRLYGDTSKMTKDKAVNLRAVYDDGVQHFECIAKTKWQGNTSIQFPKKNYNIKFIDENKNKVKKVFKNWYPTNGYHLKANWYDYSMVRNVVGTRLGRSIYPNQYPNNAMGSIDSFPCVIYINDEWHGCYTWNLSQDEDLFAMDLDNDNHLAFRGSTGFELESFEDRLREDETTPEQLAKFERMRSWAANSTPEQFHAEMEDYFDVDSVRYYWLMVDIGCCWDSLTNNGTWCSWDGKHWYILWYDVDIIFGSNWAGYPATIDLIEMGKTERFAYKYSPIWDKLCQTDMPKLKEYYAKLRQTVFPDAKTIIKYFTDYRDQWGQENLNLEYNVKWDDRINAQYDLPLCGDFITTRLAYLDEKYEYTP